MGAERQKGGPTGLPGPRQVSQVPFEQNDRQAQCVQHAPRLAVVKATVMPLHVGCSGPGTPSPQGKSGPTCIIGHKTRVECPVGYFSFSSFFGSTAGCAPSWPSVCNTDRCVSK